MKIEVKRNYGYQLIFEAENVKVTEDIEVRTYPKDENGKSIFNANPKRDISTDVLVQFTNVLDDMIYYRESEFDSSGLIERLFAKLPSDIAIKLSQKLNEEYSEV